MSHSESETDFRSSFFQFSTGSLWLTLVVLPRSTCLTMESAPWWIDCLAQPDQPMELERGRHCGVSAHTGSIALPVAQPGVGVPPTQPARAAPSPKGAPSAAQSPSAAPVLRAQTPSAAAAQTPVATSTANSAKRPRAARTAKPKPPPIM